MRPFFQHERAARIWSNQTYPCTFASVKLRISSHGLTSPEASTYIGLTIAGKEASRTADEGLRLWLARHGRTLGNDEGWVQGRIDVPLSEPGREDARQLAERMAAIPLRALYSSPLRRARETASAIGERAGLLVDVLDELIEIDMGSYERKTFGTIELETAGEAARWVFGPDRAVLGGRESLPGLLQRGRQAVDTISAQHPAGDVCIVAHAGIILAIIASCLSLSDGTFLPSILIGNASVSLLEHRLVRWLLAFANDQHHLSAQSRPTSDMLMTLFGRPDAAKDSRVIQ